VSRPSLISDQILSTDMFTVTFLNTKLNNRGYILFSDTKHSQWVIGTAVCEKQILKWRISGQRSFGTTVKD